MAYRASRWKWASAFGGGMGPVYDQIFLSGNLACGLEGNKATRQTGRTLLAGQAGPLANGSSLQYAQGFSLHVFT